MQIRLHPQTKEAYDLFHRGTLAFARAERAGMRVDIPYCKKKIAFLTKKIQRCERLIRNSDFGRQWDKVAGGNANLKSNPQLSTLLYDVLALDPPNKTDKDKGSVDDKSLRELDVPELNRLLEMRKLVKVRDTYLKPFIREQVYGVLHTFFNLHIAKTFRSSCDSPNLQNIPKRDKQAMAFCRGALLPRLRHLFLSIDFSGIEVRMACCYTQDDKLIYDTLHGDMHGDMAVEIYMLDSIDKHDDGESVLRQGGKNGFVFPEFYGDYYGNCAPTLLKWAEIAKLKNGTPALEHLASKELIRLNKKGQIINSERFINHLKNVEDDFWNVRYKKYTKWKDKNWEKYQRRGYVDLKTGFRCTGQMSRNEVNNYPFQGSAFHCLLYTFNETDQFLLDSGLDSVIVSQVHDEITLDVDPPELALVGNTVAEIATVRLPEAWTWIDVPLEVEAEKCEIDEPWSEKKYAPLPFRQAA